MQRYRADGFMEEADNGTWADYADAQSAIDAANQRASEAERKVQVLLRPMRRMGTVLATPSGVYVPASDLVEAESRLALAVAEVRAWRAWNDRDPHEPDRGIDEIENARAATDADPVLAKMLEKGGGEG